MLNWLFSGWAELASAAAKAVAMYSVALAGLRLTSRRTMAQWTAIDFVAAVAVGAIVGRTAVASDECFAVGAVALVALLLAHSLVAAVRVRYPLSKTLDHPVRVLVENGSIRHDQLRRCGITEDDLLASLRQQGVREVGQLRYVLYEAKGEITLVYRTEGPDGEVVSRGLSRAIDHP